MKGLWILTSIFIVAFAALLGIWKFGAVPFVPDVPAAATKVVSALLVVTLFAERSLAAVNAGLFGRQRKLQEGRLRDLEIGLDLNVLQSKNVYEEANKIRDKFAEISGKEETIRLAVGFAFAVLISAAGVRTLSNFIMIGSLEDGTQKALANIVDIVLTAGLIAGGSNGLAQLLQIIMHGLKPPSKLL